MFGNVKYVVYLWKLNSNTSIEFIYTMCGYR